MPITLNARKNSSVPIPKIRRSLEGLLKHLKMDRAHIELHLVGEKRIRDLNRRFLRSNRVTDVLSFPCDPTPPFPEGPWMLGEIFIATPVARYQARRARRSLGAQVIRLAVHGLVHLKGLDHEGGPKDRQQFELLERRYLKYLHEKGLMSWDGSLQF